MRNDTTFFFPFTHTNHFNQSFFQWALEALILLLLLSVFFGFLVGLGETVPGTAKPLNSQLQLSHNKL